MSSAGVCSTCGKTVDKRYGGMGRYLPECIDCWIETPEARVAREDRALDRITRLETALRVIPGERMRWLADWLDIDDKATGRVGDDVQTDLRRMADLSDAALDSAKPDGARMIAVERQRQIEEEGWTPEHDDEHALGELAVAAACYALPDGGNLKEPVRFATTSRLGGSIISALWPWESRWYKRTPKDRVRELVKAGALIAAEIDRLARAALDTEQT